MSAGNEGISFLYNWDLGNKDLVNFGSNILYVSGTASGDFDKGNMTTDPLRQVWRSASVLGWQEIIIKAELSSTIDTFAILNHNFTENAVINFQANISNNFLAPPINLFIPWQKFHIVMCQNLGANYEYYRVRVLDPTNPCGYIQIGRIVGGRAFTLDKTQNGEDITDDITYDWEDMADQLKTEGFFRASTERIKVRSLSVRFNKLMSAAPNNQNWKSIRVMSEYIGITKPFLTVVDRLDPSFISIWGQLNKLPSEDFTINRFVNLRLAMVEVW